MGIVGRKYRRVSTKPAARHQSQSTDFHEGTARFGGIGHRDGDFAQGLEPVAECPVFRIEHDREDLLRDLRRDAIHLVIVLCRIEVERLVEFRPHVVAHIHRGVDGEQEEPHPELVRAREKMRVGAHQQRKSLAMPKLVVAPLLEPFEDRVEALVGVALQVTEDRDVARIADLLERYVA